MEKAYNPHDRLVRASLEQPLIFGEFCRKHFSPSFFEKLDLSALQLQSGSYDSLDMKKLESDIVYSCRFEGLAYPIFIHVEHQSTPDRRIPFRIAEYGMAIMKKNLIESVDDKVIYPYVVSILLYHNIRNSQEQYPYELDVSQCFESPEYMQSFFTKDFTGVERKFFLVNLHEYLLEELCNPNGGTILLFEILLQNAYRTNFIEIVRYLTDTSKGVSILATSLSNASEEYIKTVVWYILSRKYCVENSNNSKEEIKEEIIQRLRSALIKFNGGNIMSEVIAYIENGAKAVGREEKETEIARNLLRQGRLLLHDIQECTGVPIDRLTVLQKELDSSVRHEMVLLPTSLDSMAILRNQIWKMCVDLLSNLSYTKLNLFSQFLQSFWPMSPSNDDSQGPSAPINYGFFPLSQSSSPDTSVQAPNHSL
jgi:predicted transposase/invertase (TIGR01784 family)